MNIQQLICSVVLLGALSITFASAEEVITCECFNPDNTHIAQKSYTRADIEALNGGPLGDSVPFAIRTKDGNLIVCCEPFRPMYTTDTPSTENQSSSSSEKETKIALTNSPTQGDDATLNDPPSTENQSSSSSEKETKIALTNSPTQGDDTTLNDPPKKLYTRTIDVTICYRFDPKTLEPIDSIELSLLMVERLARPNGQITGPVTFVFTGNRKLRYLCCRGENDIKRRKYTFFEGDCGTRFALCNKNTDCCDPKKCIGDYPDSSHQDNGGECF